MSRFVPAGISNESSDRGGEWAKAQEEVETRKREGAEFGKQDGGKSLYDTLQANKAAKQEQFEESIRLKNQFRSLDEDEVEFLDSVLESTRAREAEVKKETREQLEAFHQQQEEAERLARAAQSAEPAEPSETNWAVGPRKKRKAKDDALGGAKLRKTSPVGKRAEAAAQPVDPSPAALPLEEVQPAGPSAAHTPEAVTGSIDQKVAPASQSRPTSPPVGLGLGVYSSDDSD